MPQTPVLLYAGLNAYNLKSIYLSKKYAMQTTLAGG